MTRRVRATPTLLPRRTVRRRSHFPTVTALHNSVQKLLELSRETEGQMDYLVQELEAIRTHALREQSQRV